ncbi:MAG: AAA family ATPase [Bryobacterales bacterium]|jgi:ATP-dependent Clp protease ATP-binding subunit ClpA|nr:AAA family ATPase [Bryobacterales bacterium]
MAKLQTLPVKTRRVSTHHPAASIAEYLRGRLLGQDHVLEAVAPYLDMFQAKLNPVGRPAGIFMLLGPTGTGKTRTAEVVAEALHGSDRHLLRVDCGEYQMDHEVAKLVGAPPGYLGHRETQAVLSQQRLDGVTSEYSRLSVVLFDEIEKAAPSMARILLGILDKGFLRTGDNNPVSFENSIVFLSSNLGAKEMAQISRQHMGFLQGSQRRKGDAAEEQAHHAKTHEAAMFAVRKQFSPEFMNRVDSFLTYRALDRETLDAILDQLLDKMQEHIDLRMGMETFSLVYTDRCRNFLLDCGCSPDSGARELKRVIQRHVLQPLATLVIQRHTPAGRQVQVDYVAEEGRTVFSLLR